MTKGIFEAIFSCIYYASIVAVLLDIHWDCKDCTTHAYWHLSACTVALTSCICGVGGLNLIIDIPTHGYQDVRYLVHLGTSWSSCSQIWLKQPFHCLRWQQHCLYGIEKIWWIYTVLYLIIVRLGSSFCGSFTNFLVEGTFQKKENNALNSVSFLLVCIYS